MRDFIVSQLLRMGLSYHQIRHTPNNINIPCPYHPERIGKIDTKPSLGIYHDGRMFYCLGCGAKGNWNKIARDFGLEQIDALKKFQSNIFAVTEQEMRKLIEGKPEQLPPLLIEVQRSWRGIPQDFLHAANTYQWYDATYDVERMLWKVSTMVGKKAETVGWASRMIERRAYRQREDYEDIPKYRMSNGLDSTVHLFPEDILFAMHSDVCVLVEGPVDALHLLSHDIPTQAILGVRTWPKEQFSEKGLLGKKINKLVKAGITKTIVIMDPDEAGEVAADKIQRDLSRIMDYSAIYELPKKTRDGKKKMDPGNADDIEVMKIRKIVRGIGKWRSLVIAA